MDDILKIESISEYNKLRGLETFHPLVTVFDFAEVGAMPSLAFNLNLFAVYLNDLKCGILKYGRNHYDYQEGTLIFVAPRQVMRVKHRLKEFTPQGWGLLFDAELLKGTSLAQRIKDYTFFSYDVNEALHLSDAEREIVLDCFTKIQNELRHAVDKHSKMLIASNIELLLNYCIRFYDRQFITRENENRGILEKFERLLYEYFLSDKPKTIGLPSVAYCAEKFHLSASYFGDLIKKETGKTAKEYIQGKIIEIAKHKIFDEHKTVNEIAEELGFKYPQHFTRFFKQQVGHTPIEYRRMN
ncbi:AraC family transcriptional regulator [Chryseobacterium sp. POL2]|uniref:helix-turn-helix domain-containing protein n=1 Tax=Chryseobacterium TaxID=59732 RepID=UPI0013E12D61|nr:MULTISPECIES: helix-turn-helix domain-containing protein [Chryseobacterium]MDM1554222.1 AraC family transcriptional regulator [Chryseobacterium indologenes]QIG89696.1 AraC family transcriptional regulator [Chryseobacterium sp. POL2]